MLLRHDTNPDACSVSGDDRSKKDPSEQAEEPRTGNQVEASPQPPAESTRYPRRERRLPAYLNDYVTDLDESSIDGDQVLYNLDYCNKVSAFPQTYQEAIGFPESENWRAAMKEEMDFLAENNTLTLTALQVGRNSLGGSLGVHNQKGFWWC